jgi:hypothetical protein
VSIQKRRSDYAAERFHMQKGHVRDPPSVQQLDLIRHRLSERDQEKRKTIQSIPISSQVCSFAELSLLIIVDGPAPFGAAAVWTAGEMAAA